MQQLHFLKKKQNLNKRKAYQISYPLFKKTRYWNDNANTLILAHNFYKELLKIATSKKLIPLIVHWGCFFEPLVICKDCVIYVIWISIIFKVCAFIEQYGIIITILVTDTKFLILQKKNTTARLR